MKFPEQVEKWRPLVEKYFPPELVEKALWVIQHESGGNPTIRGDNGVAIGLFQIQDSTRFAGRPDAEWLSSPENNIKYAAQNLGAASGNWQPWGEGATYQGERFGALGNHPFPGDSSGNTVSSNITVPDFGDDVASPSLYGDPQIDAQYRELQQRTLDTFDAWVRAGQPSAGPQFERWLTANNEFETFVRTYGEPQQNAITPEEKAQQTFENEITLGDYQLRDADQAFRHWREKNLMAQDAANEKLSSIDEHNLRLIERQEARNASVTPGLHHRATEPAMIRPSYNDVLDEFESRYGAGGAAPAGVGAAGVGAAPVGTGSTPQEGAALNEATAYANSGALGSGQGASMPRPNYDIMYKPRSLQDFEDAARNWRDGTMAGPGSSASTFDQWWNRIGGATNDRGRATFFGQTFGDIDRAGTGIAQGAQNQVKRGANTVKRWWQRGFAEGGTNIPAQRAFVGEKGPEIMEVPGFGARMVGVDGPEEMDIPQGANIMPLDEAFTFEQIRRAAAQPGRPGGQRALSRAERANDPQLQQKVIEAINRGTASHFAANPPPTPVLTDPRVKDRWAQWRPLTGVPPMPQPAEPAKGAKR